MIEYGELVQYIKDNHVNWHTDLFEVLRGFFEEYYQKKPEDNWEQETIKEMAQYPQAPQMKDYQESVQLGIVFDDFKEPQDGEYSTEDVLALFST